MAKLYEETIEIVFTGNVTEEITKALAQIASASIIPIESQSTMRMLIENKHSFDEAASQISSEVKKQLTNGSKS